MRLIDADALIEILAEHRDFYAPNLTPLVNEAMTDGLRIAIREVKNSPTVDIKTEVAREIFAKMEEIIQMKLKILDIFIENENIKGQRYAVEQLDRKIAKLKNKYTKEGVGE